MRAAHRALIVNADDFGQSAGINRGIIHAHERGIVTSASLMVRWPAALEAAAYAKRHPRLSVGLHLDLGEWRYVSQGWQALYTVVDFDDLSAITDEVHGQFERFRQLLGCDPTHLDSHQHVHQDEPVRSAMQQLSARLGVPLRHYAGGVAYRGDFYGQTETGQPLPDAIRVEAFVRILQTLSAGITEVGCHPAEGIEDLTTMYRDERRVEMQVLSDPRLREAVEALGIRLCSFQMAQLGGRSGKVLKGVELNRGHLVAKRSVKATLLSRVITPENRG